jgi:hypothetical protein
MVKFLCQFQQVEINLGPGYKNLTLNCWFLPFKPNTLITLVLSSLRIWMFILKKSYMHNMVIDRIND